MGNQKLKWTAEEEKALLDGIGKHGAGKWKNILRDPEFADQLTNRSNIDLKDKWRNLSVAPGTQGSIKARPIKIVPPHDDIIVPPDLIIDDSSNIETKNAPRYDGMIFEALSVLADANGCDVGSIFNFLEPRHDVPTNFRRILSSRLRRLAAQGKLEKSQNFYKIPDPSGTRIPAPKPKDTNIKPRQSNNQAPAVSQEMIEEGATTAAFKVVEAENYIDLSKVAEEELEKMTKLAEATEYVLEIAKEMGERCSSGEVVDLA